MRILVPRGRRPRRLLRRAAPGGGRDVAFLVRPRRRAQLERDGWSSKAPTAPSAARCRCSRRGGRAGLGRRAARLQGYDLEDADRRHPPGGGRAHRRAAGAERHSHIETLQRAFGAERVLGGLAKIQATLAPDGTVRHLNDWRYLTFGEMDGRMSPRVQALAKRRPARRAWSRRPCRHRLPHVGEAGPSRHQRRFHRADARQRGRDRPAPRRRGTSCAGCWSATPRRRRPRPPDARRLHGGVPRRVLGPGERLLRLRSSATWRRAGASSPTTSSASCWKRRAAPACRTSCTRRLRPRQGL
jgi:hypothetical protein